MEVEAYFPREGLRLPPPLHVDADGEEEKLEKLINLVQVSLAAAEVVSVSGRRGNLPILEKPYCVVAGRDPAMP